MKNFLEKIFRNFHKKSKQFTWSLAFWVFRIAQLL